MTPPNPNLIYVFADQLRYGSCGFAGDRQALTPHMDRLAAESVYDNAISFNTSPRTGVLVNCPSWA